MEKLRRWNCTNEGNCYDLIEKNTYAGICANCEQFAASKERMGNVAKALKKQKARLRRRALKKMKAAAAAEAAAAAAAAEAASKQQKRYVISSFHKLHQTHSCFCKQVSN